MRILALLFFIFPLLLWEVSGQAYFGQKGVGKLFVHNNKVILHRKNTAIPVNHFGIIVEDGDKIETDKTGKARLEMHNGDIFYLATSTVMQVKKEEKSSGLKQFIFSTWGKIRSQIQKTVGMQKSVVVKTPTATIGIKGTDFVVEHRNKRTRVGTIQGLVTMSSSITGEEINIPSGKMSRMSAQGNISPLMDFAGSLLSEVEFAGEKLGEEDVGGEKIDM